MFSAQDTLPELWFRLQSNMMATCNNWSQPAARTAFSFDEFKLTSCATLSQVTVARTLVRRTNKGYYFAERGGLLFGPLRIQAYQFHSSFGLTAHDFFLLFFPFRTAKPVMKPQ